MTKTEEDIDKNAGPGAGPAFFDGFGRTVYSKILQLLQKKQKELFCYL
ncbi:hypothetical protein [Hungatella hathewayi]|nr:hypothetical protein [Hungatella hathewayi]